ncbi:MAG: gliding motility-associated C-terminal domain-containing protein [Saprospiraceae bacterium]
MNQFIYLRTIFFLFIVLIGGILLQAGAEPGKPGRRPATKPTFTDPVPADVTIACVDDIPAPVNLNATDDNDPSFPKSIAPVDSPSPASLGRCAGGVIIRRWIAVDAVDNLSDTVIQRITVAPDTVKPQLPAMLDLNKTELCDTADYSAWLNSARLTITTNAVDCNLDFANIADDAPMAFNAKCDSSILVTFTIPDLCGNVTTFLATYTVIDNKAPVLVGVPMNFQDSIAVSCSNPVIPPAPVLTAQDNCTPNLTVKFQEVSGQDTVNLGCSRFQYVIVRTWSVADSCGNDTSLIQRIFVRDTEPPAFTDPNDATISCEFDAKDLMITGNVTGVSDNCTPLDSIVIAFTDMVLDSICPFEYTIQRTWTAKDLCGNVNTKVQLIDVVDDQLPTFTVPADTIVACSQTPSPTVTGMPTAVDGKCDASPTITFEDVIEAGDCINAYTVKRTWIVADDCGAKTTKVQTITVVDTLKPVLSGQAQDLELVCDNALDAATAFNNWINTRAGVTATDNCTADDKLVWKIVESGTNTPATLPGLICPAPDSIIRGLTVDFIVTDECGNADTTTASFIVLDDMPPNISNCPKDTTIAANPGDCEATFSLQPPVIEEECFTSANTEDITVTANISSNAMPGQEGETPVNPVTLEFNLTSTSPINATGNATLRIDLNQIDAEATEEYFNIIGEDGTVLGKTAKSDTQCDTSITNLTLTPAQINKWAVDKKISIRLVPNIPANQPGSFAINALCNPASTAIGRLQLQTKIFNNLTYEYRINNAAKVAVNPVAPVTVTLEPGENIITYYATDCAGLTDSCSYKVKVEDREPPVLTCPPDIIVNLDSNKCVAPIQLPLPLGVTDNCAAGTSYEVTLPNNLQEAYLTFNLDPNLNTYQANARTYTFTNVAANAVADATLTLDVLGDFNTNGAFMRIIGENNTVLGVTPNGLSNCTTPGQFTVTIPKDTINRWAADGSVQIQLQPNVVTVPPGVAGDGINPCDSAKVKMNGGIDSTSFALVTLQFEQLTPSFYTTGALTTPLTPMTPPVVTPTINFPVGETQVFYILTDKSNNADTCSYNITVEDKQKPIARCQPTTIFINPSGLDVETIPANVIDAGSTDNCMIDTMFLTPNTFNCAQVGANATVTLTVVDLAGNTNTCQSLVRIQAEEPMPTANSGLCGGDSLFLFANPPAATGGIIYTYSWTGPNGFSSTQRNPKIPNISSLNAGTYRVEVTGITGCKSVGTVQVAIEDLPLTPAVVTPANVCVNQDIVLNSSVVPSGSNVTYRWYRGTPPMGTLIGTTSVPAFTIPQPHAPGSNSYYLTIEADGCLSAPSAPFTVTANSIPTAVVNDAEISVCEGGNVTLGTLVAGPGITYQWTGPNNYSSTNQLPPVINSITPAGGGVYSLVVLRNGCPSPPAFTVVNVRPKPAPPRITSSGAVCEGSSVTLTTTTTGATIYHWVSPTLQEFLTTTNSYTINNATTMQSGPWRLYVTQNGCSSDPSTSTNVVVNTLPTAVASANPNQVCEGGELRLLSSPTLNDAQYIWTGPNNYTAASQNPPPITNVTQNREGIYRVIIKTQAGCADTATVNVDVLKGVTVSGVSNSGQSCLAGPTDIQLFGTVFPLDDGTYTYRWTGPNFVSSDSVALIPNATEANNGNYQLIVTNGEGCSSQPKTTVVNVTLPPATPLVPTISASTPAPYCEGKPITIIANAVSGAQVNYLWRTPKGNITTPTSALNLENPTVADNGLYSVIVIVNGCPSKESGPTSLNISAKPRIFASANSPVCTSDTIQLNATFIPGATYTWQGPRGFTSAVPNPPIPFANSSLHNGFYKVSAVVNGCISNLDSVQVNVNARPRVPTISNSGAICIDEEGAVLRLSVSNASAVPNADYVWYNQSGDTVGITQTLNLDITDFTDYTDGNYLFTAATHLNGCSSALSAPTTVAINTIPEEQAFAGDDKSICEVETIALSARQPRTGSGRWSVVQGDTTGVRFTNPFSPTSAITGLRGDSIYLFRWTLSNGVCQNYDADTVKFDLIPVEVPSPGNDTLVCATDQITLDALMPATGRGQWSQSTAQSTLGIRILETGNPNTVVQGLQPGNIYEFTWKIIGGCGELSSSVFVSTSDTDLFAGDDAIVCNDQGNARLDADNPAIVSFGQWSSPDPKISFSNSRDPKATASNLVPGDNIFVWTIDDALCGNAGRDTVIINYKENPRAQADVIAIEFGKMTPLDVLENDLTPAGTTIRVTVQPTKGKVEMQTDGTIAYTPGINFVGRDELTYEICSEGCQCSTAKVTINVGEDAACAIPSIITPNGDGINDLFVIPCFIDDTNYPNSQISIFNRWGDEVYRSEIPYRNTWDGTFNGENLPVGTYFYIVNLGDGSEAKTGFVMIQR